MPAATRATATGSQTTDSVTHVVNLPGSIVAGEILLAFYSHDTATATISSLTNGWQILGSQTQGTTGNHTGYVLWKRATGTDGLTVTLSTAEQGTWITKAVGGAHATATPTIATPGSYGADVSPQVETMPALSGLPVDDYLAILSIHTDSSTTQAQTFTAPAGFANPHTVNPTTTGSAATFTCERSYTDVDAITPGTASWSAAEQGVAHLVAIAPAAAGTTTKSGSDSATVTETASAVDITPTGPVVAALPTIAAATQAAAGNSPTVAPGRPTGLQVGDYLICPQTSDADGSLGAMTAPGGWLALASRGGQYSPRMPYVKLWGKVATSADVSAATFAFPDGTGANCAAGVLRIPAGAYDPDAPIRSITWASSTTRQTTHRAPSVPGVPGALLVTVHTADMDGVSGAAYTPPPGMAEHVDVASSAGWVILEVASQRVTSADPTGVRTATLTGASFPYVGISFLIAPPPNAVAGVSSTDVATLSDSATVFVLPAVQKSGSDSATLSDSATVSTGGGGAASDSATLRETASVQVVGPLGDAVVEAEPVEVLKVVDLEPADLVLEGPEATTLSRVPTSADLVVEGPDIVAGKGGSPTTSRGLPPVYTARPWRFIAQRILSGEFVSWELPVTDPEVEWRLSGTTEISGSFKPQIRDVADLGLEPWGTWIHLEEDGLIRASAIMQPTSVEPDGTFSFTAVGTHGYASRVPYRDRLELVEIDPAQIVRLLWAHIQSFPRGNLGVEVLGSTPVRVGKPAEDVEFTTGAGEQVSFVAGPYKVNWWENTLIGKEVEDLAKETPFDFREVSEWADEARSRIRHRILIDYPQAGSRRFDLRFSEDENVTEKAPIEEPGDAYADTIYVGGKGEGIDQITGSAGTVLGERLRLPAIVDDKTISSIGRANAVAAEELAARMAALVEVPEIVVDARHRNAPLGSFGGGDEIRPILTYPYIGRVEQWHRVTSVRYLPTRDRMIVGLTRRGEFRG